MQTRFIVTAQDWPQFRFAHSALFETLQAVRTLGHRRQQQFHQRWLDTFDRKGILARIPALAALTPGTGPVWIPDFLAPPPRHIGISDIEEELQHVAMYPPKHVREDLQRSLDSQPTDSRRRVLQPLISQPARARRELIAELRIAWETLAKPFWPAIARLITDDITFRSRQITRYGLGHLLNDIHGDITVQTEAITVRYSEQVTVALDGRSLLLMPSAFLWPHPIAVHETPWPPALVYPARGVGNLWASPPRPPRALAHLLGRSRAQILLDLDEPRDTTTIAARHQLSPATTSAHLKRLHAAGLVTAHRDGRQVRYQWTDLGAALISAVIQSPVRPSATSP